MRPESTGEQRRIRILPDRLANLIAAGEVVERPSAVVKELVENALDAGATNVAVNLDAGGRRLMQVTDNGCGMSPDDAVLALDRHATSKIADPTDLDSIASYGFRGEALPSIAAVSRLRLQTCHDDDGIGTEVVVEGGQLKGAKEVGRARGTTMTIRDLFFNTPARRKFLRTDQTELRHCSREITGLALGSPEVAFRLAHAGRALLDCPAARSWQERALALFGQEMLERGLEFSVDGDFGRIYGLLGRPGDAGGGYREQYILVNGRLVQARALRKAVFDGYEATIESGNQPSFVVFLDTDPAGVDVNVHPQKREVRFRDERAVYGFVKDAVAQAFSGSVSPRDAVRHSEGDDEARGVGHFWHDAKDTFARKDASRPRGTPSGSAVRDSAYAAPPAQRTPATDSVGTLARALDVGAPDRSEGNAGQPGPVGQQVDDQLALDVGTVPGEVSAPAEASARAESTPPEISPESLLWQFQDKYIFVSTNEGLWIVDQHVAHERILYEEAMAAFNEGEPTSQRLLLPVAVELTPEQDSVLDEVLPALSSMGFDIERMSGRSVLVNAYPASVQNWQDGNLLREMVQEIGELGFRESGLTEQIATSYSCHAAIKAGDPLNAPTMAWLVERLFSTSMPYVCPHGRPIIVKIGTKELDKRFGRA